MGTAERAYSRGQAPGALQRLTPAVKFLLIANLAIYLLDIFTGEKLREIGAFTVEGAILSGKIWQFLTFQFLHSGIGHLLGNSIGLFFFGPFMERHWGRTRFVAFYLLCGLAGAAFYTLLLFLGVFPAGTSVYTGLIGASAGVYGILVGVAVISPNMRVALLLPPIELSMRQLAIGVLVIATGMILLRGGNEGGEAGHLGGAILGYLLIKHPRLLAWAQKRERQVEIIRPKTARRRSEAKIRPRSEIDLNTQTEVDRILDKISRDGFQSLTDAERAVLQKASEAHKPNR